MSSPTTAIGSSGNEDQNFKNGSNGFGSENKLKLKLKLGGVTRTIHTKSTTDHAFGGVPSLTKSSHFSDAPQTRENTFSWYFHLILAKHWIANSYQLILFIKYCLL